MQPHRTYHDFGELTYEDVADMRSAFRSGRSVKEKVRANLYSSIFAALTVGIVVGYLARRH